MKAKKKTEKPRNLLDLVPERLVEWEEKEDETVVLLVPRYRTGLLARFLQPRLKQPYFRVTLDAFGTFIWKACDGERTVAGMADRLREAHGEAVEPVYERVGLFVQNLFRNQFVKIKGE